MPIVLVLNGDLSKYAVNIQSYLNKHNMTIWKVGLISIWNALVCSWHMCSYILNQPLSLYSNFPFQTTLLNHTGVCTSTYHHCYMQRRNWKCCSSSVVAEDAGRQLEAIDDVSGSWGLLAVQCTPLYTLWSDLELLCLQQARWWENLVCSRYL